MIAEHETHNAHVIHNLIFGCLLIFLIQWVFLGDFAAPSLSD